VPEPLHGSPTDGRDGVRVRDIGGDRMNGGALVGEPGGLRQKVLFVDIGHDDAHALGHEGFDDGQADSAGGSGHDRRAPLQPLHCRRILCRRRREPLRTSGGVTRRIT